MRWCDENLFIRQPIGVGGAMTISVRHRWWPKIDREMMSANAAWSLPSVSRLSPVFARLLGRILMAYSLNLRRLSVASWFSPHLDFTVPTPEGNPVHLLV